MNFNERQLEAINSRGNVALLAGSGSGKSAVVIERIKSLVSDGVLPENILSISFSKEAVNNLEKRLKKENIEGVNVKTFHGLAYQIIKKKDPRWNVFTQTWEKEKIISDSLKANDYPFRVKEDIPFSEIFKFISTQKHNMVKGNKCIEVPNMSIDFEILKNVYKDYERYRISKFYIDFDDMVNKAVELLNEYPYLLDMYQSLFKYILVDETQDISLNQFVFMKLLNNNNQLFVVGDAKQSIYKFRNSNPKYLINFDTYMPNATVINMNVNYRSSEEIVYLANCIAEYDSVSKDKNYEKAVSNKGSYARPQYIRYNTEFDMIEDIKTKIIEFKNKGYDYKDMVILTRTNSELQNYESSLSLADIPYVTFTNTCFLDAPEIKLICSYLFLAYDVFDNDSFVVIYNKPNRYLGKEFLNSLEGDSLYEAMSDIDKRIFKWKKGIDDIIDIIETLKSGFESVGHMIKWLIKRLDLDNYYKNEYEEDTDKIDSIHRFEQLCYRFKSLDSFKNFTMDIRSKNSNKSKDKVALMTAHKSKGLEYKIVFVTGLNENQFPHSKCEDIESELRLFYVACTRAEEHLYITSADNIGTAHRTESRFVKYLGDSVDYIKHKTNKHITYKDEFSDTFSF